MNEVSKTTEKQSKLNAPAAIASSASGITLLLNYFLPLGFNMPSEEAKDLMTITPVLGGAIAWAISRGFQAYGRDPQLISNERVIKRRIKLLKQDLKDPNILDAEKEILKKDYAKLRKLLRHPELLSSITPRKTSNQG